MTRNLHRRLILGTAAVMVAAALPVGIVAGRPGDVDITATAHGRSVAAQAREQFREQGAPDVPLRVVSYRNGLVTIAMPASNRPSDVKVSSDGTVRVTTEGLVAGATQSTQFASTSLAAAAAPYWQQQGASSCYHTIVKTPVGKNGGFMDLCFRLHKLINDADSYWDYWDISSWATVDATATYAMGDYAWIHVDRDGGPTFYWEDWNPRADKTGDCSDISLSVSAKGIGLSLPGISVCETWSLTKYTAGGTLKNQWNGNSAGAREVALMSAIHVRQGQGSPIWGVSWFSKIICYQGLPCGT